MVIKPDPNKSIFNSDKNIYYTDCEELRNQEGYPHWGADYYNDQIGNDHLR